MALIFAEGCDHYGGYNPLWRKSWPYPWGQTTGRGDTGHGFSRAYRFFSPRTTLAAGIAYRTAAFSNQSLRFCDLNRNRIIGINIRPDGRLGASSAMGGGASASAQFVLNRNEWTYHELRSTISLIQPDPPRYQASYEIWINERPVLSGAISPLILPSPSFECLDLVGPGGGSSFWHDDLYITDGEILGDVRIEALHPGSDGIYSDWTPDTGSDHYDRVDEAEIDDDTSYLAADPVGAKDSHLLAAHDTGNTSGIFVWLGVKQEGGTAVKIRPFLRIGGVDYPGDEQTPSDQYIFRGQGYLTNPATGLAWTDADLDALELGIGNSS